MLSNVASLPIDESEVKTADGRWLARTGGSANTIARASEDGGQTIIKGSRLAGNVVLDYNIIPEVKLTASYGMVRNQNRLRDYAKILTLYDQSDHDLVAGRNEFNTLKIGYVTDMQQNANLLANYSQKFNNHSISVLAGFTAEWFDVMNDGISTRNFLTDDIYSVSAGTTDPTFWGHQRNSFRLVSGLPGVQGFVQLQRQIPA
ncbi:MAG: hypothetical protein WDO16_09365 [Bacteroidota bacterium]